MYICIYIYIYVYIHTYLPNKYLGKGQMGSALIGVAANVVFLLAEGPFRDSRKPTFSFPKVPGRAFFPNLLKLITFAAALLVSTPSVRNQGYRKLCTIIIIIIITTTIITTIMTIVTTNYYYYDYH